MSGEACDARKSSSSEDRAKRGGRRLRFFIPHDDLQRGYTIGDAVDALKAYMELDGLLRSRTLVFVVTFAYVTGWRINSEVLPLQWRQVDLKAGEVRLDP